MVSGIHLVPGPSNSEVGIHMLLWSMFFMYHPLERVAVA